VHCGRDGVAGFLALLLAFLFLFLFYSLGWSRRFSSHVIGIFILFIYITLIIGFWPWPNREIVDSV